MEVKIKLLPGGKMPTKGSAGAAAFDCYAREDINVEDFPRLIGLGFALELPPGYHAKIFPRSSTGLKTDLRQPNSCGIIDSDYRGEVKAMYESKLNASYEGGCGCTVQHIKAGDRIAQMLIERNVDVEFVVVDELSETDRGAGGFGSTGFLSNLVTIEDCFECPIRDVCNECMVNPNNEAFHTCELSFYHWLQREYKPGYFENQ